MVIVMKMILTVLYSMPIVKEKSQGVDMDHNSQPQRDKNMCLEEIYTSLFVLKTVLLALSA